MAQTTDFKRRLRAIGERNKVAPWQRIAKNRMEYSLPVFNCYSMRLRRGFLGTYEKPASTRRINNAFLLHEMDTDAIIMALEDSSKAIKYA